MGQYGNATLQERIERRRKRDRTKKLKKALIVIAIILLIAAIGVGVYFLTKLNSDNTEAPEVDNIPEQVVSEAPPEEEPKPDTEKPDAEKPVGKIYDLSSIGTSIAMYAMASVAEPIEEIRNELRVATFVGSELDPNKPMIALTFDDGPHATNTMRVLDALESVGGRATFFVLGELIDGKSDVLKRASDMGCEIGNHSFDHSNFTKLNAAQMQQQLSSTSELVKNATGKTTALVRVPYGSVNATIRSAVGAPMIGCSLDTRDWESRNADKVVAKVLNNVKDGDIIIMHDIYSSTADAVERIVPELVKRGYQLVTVSELMAAREVNMENGKIYYQAVKK